MSKKIKQTSRILEAVYETASDLHACGVLNDEKMRQYEEIYASPVPIYLDQDVLDHLNKKVNFDSENLRILINDLLRKDIEIAKSVAL